MLVKEAWGGIGSGCRDLHPPMDYYLTRNQETFGPYSEKELRDHLKSGAVLPDDYAWHEGQSEWIPLHRLLPSEDEGKVETPAPLRSVAVSEKPSGEPSPGHPEKEAKRRSGLVPGILGALVLTVLAYASWPYCCLLILNHAMGSGNTELIRRLVDFPKIEASFREESALRINTAASGGNPGGYLGVDPVMIPMAVETISTQFLTPDGLAALLSSPDVALRQLSSGTFASMSAQSVDPALVNHAFFTGPTTFLVRIEGLQLRFTLSGGFWRLVAIEFP